MSSICQKEDAHHEAFALRARCNYHFGDFQRALYDYSVAIRLCETTKEEKHKTGNKLAEYHNYAGVQHFELGQFDEALNHYNIAIEKDK